MQQNVKFTHEQQQQRLGQTRTHGMLIAIKISEKRMCFDINRLSTMFFIGIWRHTRVRKSRTSVSPMKAGQAKMNAMFPIIIGNHAYRSIATVTHVTTHMKFMRIQEQEQRMFRDLVFLIA
jgi:hypothetical protein